MQEKKPKGSLMPRLIAAMMFALLTSCAHAAQSSITSAAPDIYVMRHLHAGSGDDASLTTEAATQAQLLPVFFGRDAPRTIYASTLRRAQETAAPLAQGLGLTVKIYDPRDTPALISAVRQETGTVLIVGHSNTVPEIVEALSGTRPDPIAHSEYGDIWQVRGSDRELTKLRLEQR
jgi:phosphohistidine phosphatase SixA